MVIGVGKQRSRLRQARMLLRSLLACFSRGENTHLLAGQKIHLFLVELLGLCDPLSMTTNYLARIEL